MAEDNQYTTLGRLLEILLSAVFVALLLGILWGAKAFGADLPAKDPILMGSFLIQKAFYNPLKGRD